MNRYRRMQLSRMVLGLSISVASGCAGSAGAGASPDAAALDAGLAQITITTVVPFTAAAANADLVALQDGDGAWHALTGTDGVYHATITGPRYGVAVGCGTGTRALRLYYQAFSDTTELVATGCDATPAFATAAIDLRGTGTNPDRQTEVSIGAYSLDVVADGAYSLPVPKQRADVFAFSATRTENPDVVRDVVAYRGPTLDVDGDLALSIDMATMAKPLEAHPLTLIDPPAPSTTDAQVEILSSYITAHSQYANSSIFAESIASPPPLETTTRYMTVDATLRQPGDVSDVWAAETGTTAQGFGYIREVDLETSTNGPLTATLPDLLIADAPTLQEGPIPQLTVTLPIVPTTTGHAWSLASFSTRAADRTFFNYLETQVSPGWAAGQATVTIITPDLSNLPGWTPAMALRQAAAVKWYIWVAHDSRPYGAPRADNAWSVGSSLFGTLAATTPALSALDRSLPIPRSHLPRRASSTAHSTSLVP